MNIQFILPNQLQGTTKNHPIEFLYDLKLSYPVKYGIISIKQKIRVFKLLQMEIDMEELHNAASIIIIDLRTESPGLRYCAYSDALTKKMENCVSESYFNTIVKGFP